MKKRSETFKILYAVQGEGMGHSTRSKSIIEELTVQGHNIHILAGSRAFTHLFEFFKNITKIKSTHIIYKNNKVTSTGTVLNYIKNIPQYIKTMFKIKRTIKSFNPQIIISDFEPFTAYVSLFMRIKLISLDNEQIQIRTRIKWPWHEFFAYFKSWLIVRLWMPKANYYLITTFFYPEKIKNNSNNKDNVFLFPPIVRKSIRNLKTKKGTEILVYQTSKTNNKLLKVLKQIKNHNFVIYGFEKNQTIKNCEFRKFADHKSFFKTFANCKAVIMNGGFSLISECLYLRKPILSIPVKSQFEQLNNARYLEEMGYGKYIKDANSKDIIYFLNNLKQYEKNLKNFKREDNSKLINKLNDLFKIISSKKEHR